jgi:raffinose/stachyose/melibiose transport system substrate-binding protein
MTTQAPFSRRSLLAMTGAGAGAVMLGACSGNSGGGSKTSNQTIEWWHIANTDPGMTLFADIAKEFEAAHSNVKIKITPLQNDAFKAKLNTVNQAGNPPDIFHTWGGGVLGQQAQAGLVKDVSKETATLDLIPSAMGPYTINGKAYAFPTDTGMIGIWYNKELFTKAGISATPSTWAEFLDDVKKLKAAGVTPLALAGKAKWPGHYYWAYLAMRVAGIEALKKAADSKSFDNPDFVTAGKHVKDLVDLQPFQKGFLGADYDTPDGQAATMGNAQAAMELMGQWAPGVERNSSTSKNGLGDKLGFFAFPTVDGGKGAATDAFGGGGGFAVGKDAPPATIDFLKFLLSQATYTKYISTNNLLPVVKGMDSAVTDPNLKLVSATLAKATAFQLYLDQAYPPAVGQQVNDSVAQLMAGKETPEQVVKDITGAAQR